MMYSNNETQEGLKLSGSKTKSLPGKEADLISVAQSVQVKISETGICPLWTSAEEMSAKISDIEMAKNTIRDLQSKKRQLTNEIRILNTDVDIGAGYVKSALDIKFGRERSLSYAHEFGFDIRAGRRLIKINMDDRLRSLSSLIAAISKYDLQVGDYSIDFWTNLETQLKSLWSESRALSSQISLQVSKKAKALNYLRANLQSVIYLIRGHYPDNSKGILREWGFLKESF